MDSNGRKRRKREEANIHSQNRESEARQVARVDPNTLTRSDVH
jgi:hypothetical protein